MKWLFLRATGDWRTVSTVVDWNTRLPILLFTAFVNGTRYSRLSDTNRTTVVQADLIGFGLTEPSDAQVGIGFGLRTRT